MLLNALLARERGAKWGSPTKQRAARVLNAPLEPGCWVRTGDEWAKVVEADLCDCDDRHVWYYWVDQGLYRPLKACWPSVYDNTHPSPFARGLKS